MSFLIDTNICSAYLRGPGALFHRFMQHSGRLNVSTVTLAELYSWTLRRNSSPRFQAILNALLNDMHIIHVEHDIARRFGEVRSQRLDRGLAAPPMDMLIAATALVHGLTVVTHNVADFTNVPGLQVVDWLVP